MERALNFFLSIKSSPIIYLLLFNSCWLLNATSGSGNPETADCWKKGGYWWGSGKGITLYAPCYYILLLSICLCLLSKAGYWAGWIFHLTLDGSSHVFGEWSGVWLWTSIFQDLRIPDMTFPSCLNLYGCSASSIICFPQILLTAEVQHRGRGRVGPLLKGCVFLCLYGFILAWMEILPHTPE